MPDRYLETKGELTAELNPTKKKKKRPWWDIPLTVFIVALIACLTIISANVLYLKCSYDFAFFVDGASMYPALNGNALKKEKDGSYRKVTWADINQSEGDLVDYGWAKSVGDGFSDLKRFDIVITYYSKDMAKQADGSYKPKDGAVLKVKRVVGFPGETIQISPDKDEDGNISTPWGTLTVTSPDGNASVYPSYYTFEDYEDVMINGVKTSYRNLFDHEERDKSQTYGPEKLGENTYFVLGDNRAPGKSSDSRNGNYVYDYCLVGKACVITSLRELKKSGSGIDASFRLDKIRPFWDYAYLDGSKIEKTKKDGTSYA